VLPTLFYGTDWERTLRGISRKHLPCPLPVSICSFAHSWPSHGLKPNACNASHVRQLWQSCFHRSQRQRAARPLYCFAAMSTSARGAVLFSVGVVWGDTLFLVGNLQSPDPNERPVLPTVIVMCQFHFPTQKWTRLRLRHAPEICHYPLLAAYEDQLVLFGGDFLSCTMPGAHMLHSRCTVYACKGLDGNGWADGRLQSFCVCCHIGHVCIWIQACRNHVMPYVMAYFPVRNAHCLQLVLLDC